MALTPAQILAREGKLQCLSCGQSFVPKYWRKTRPQIYCSQSCSAIYREKSRELPIKSRLIGGSKNGPNGCWLWTGARSSNGYGVITIHNKTKSVHVEAYKAFKGKIPKGLCVLHTCDIRPCINPQHLWIGTKGDNNRDAAKKGRSFGFLTNGEANSLAKFTNTQAKQIKNMANDGENQRSIARKMGVSEMTISRIVRNQTYRK